MIGTSISKLEFPVLRQALIAWIPSALAAAAIGLVPVWLHLVLVDSGLQGIIAVFGEVGIYPSDVCLGLLALLAVARPVALDSASRLLALGLALLASSALLSALVSADPRLAGGLAAQLALFTLAWLGLRSAHVSRSLVVAALCASAAVQAGLAAAQFICQQPLVPVGLQLPWLPHDPSQDGAPVILNAVGDRFLRGFGTFPHPNVLGGYLAIALVCLPVLGRRSPGTTALWWVLGITLGVGLLASFSRAAWLAALLGLGIQWYMGVRWSARSWWVGIVSCAVVAGLWLTPVAPLLRERLLPLGQGGNALERGSIENRLALDEAALVEIAHHWPKGVGAANYGLASVDDGYQEGWGEPVPNLPLLISAELGLPGVIALMFIVFGTLRLRLDLATAGAFCALIVLASFDHYLWTMPLGRVIAWTPFALMASAPRRLTRLNDANRVPIDNGSGP